MQVTSSNSFGFKHEPEPRIPDESPVPQFDPYAKESNAFESNYGKGFNIVGIIFN